MTNRIGFTLLLALTVALSACPKRESPATVLYFVEQEKGSAPARTRIIISREFVRFDDDADGKDFLLFDRVAKTIYSVNSADQRTLIIEPRSGSVKSPIPLTDRVLTVPGEYPSVAGAKVNHYRLLTNDQLCYDLFAAETLLPQAVAALREFYTVLATQESVALPQMPKEFQTPCELANHVFAPARHLAHGLPIRTTDMNGKTRELMDFREDFSAPLRLFAVPVEYKQTRLEELRGK
jgi:hypothetical protein